MEGVGNKEVKGDGKERVVLWEDNNFLTIMHGYITYTSDWFEII